MSISTTNSLRNPRVALALETTLLLCDFDRKLLVIVTLYELSRHFDMSRVMRKTNVMGQTQTRLYSYRIWLEA